ncbi:MAG: PEGA domain-containing protein [Polyangiaceae bacterium]|nr:PEGA domain-containing protein [Polyangiaceae bacterium]MCL4749020.1 PEGA domain-containing protein [Myxococcales bacterium]
MQRALVLCTLFVLLTGLTPRTVLGQKPGSSPTISKAPDTLTAEARARFEEGVRAAAKRDFEAARVAFKQAFALKPVPEVLRNLGAAEVMSGHELEGARHLTEYLAGARELAKRERDELVELVRKAENELGRLELEVDADGATITVGGETVGQSPLGWVWHVSPGEHEVAASKAGAGEAKQTVRVAAGALEKVGLRLSEAGGAAPPEASAGAASPSPSPSGSDGATPAAPSPAKRSIVPAVIGGGVAAVGIGLGVMWGLGAASDADDADAILDRLGPAPCGTGTPYAAQCAEVSDKNDSSRRKSNLSTASFVVGGVALAGTVVYLLWPEPTAAAGWIRPSAQVGTRGAQFGLEGRFF